MHETSFDVIIKLLREYTKQSPEPMTREIVALYNKDPFLILVSCLLSLQTRDVVTLPISMKLFQVVRTPQQLLALPLSELETIIKPINYYKTKAQRLRSVSQELLSRFSGKVPCSTQDLLSMKGIGIKTAHLVAAEAFDIPAICVDTHVHRLSNKWGLIQTKNPDETEKALRMILPKKYWIEWNYLLVKWGQYTCKTKKIPCPQCHMIIKELT
ncbi:MAG: endonuclease III [Epsilonproteobacteria bacterium]|nr:endonuclease III [Campylobacterota bacterium]|tara:strand:+ start:2091 stop:2729 length:639 start_codon:yes stop_codon:yes gene_type:complete